jgi:hypothetical protein
MTSFMAPGQVGVIRTLAYPLDSEAFSAQWNLQHHHVIKYTMSKKPSPDTVTFRKGVTP